MQHPSGGRSSPGTLRDFAAFYLPHLPVFVLDLVCALFIALVDVLFPVLTRKMLYEIIPDRAYGTFSVFAC